MRLLRHGTVDSTSERAFAALAAGTARDGDVHVATGQTAGRGRRGRPWVSQPDAGLYCSAIHLPPPPGPSPAALTMAAGLAVLEAVRALVPASVGGTLRLDWPNDLVADGAKLAGVLVESRGLDPARPHYVVGVGVNVRQRSFPADLLAERPVTSLALLGVDLDPDALLVELVPRLTERLRGGREDPAGLGRDFLVATDLLDRGVLARTADATHRGRLTDLAPDRGLALETPDSGEIRLDLAHVRALEPAPSPL